MVYKKIFIVFLFFTMSSAACNKKDTIKKEEPKPVIPVPPIDDNQILKITTGWVIDTIATGFIHYNLSGYYAETSANQNVNVLEVDVLNPAYILVFKSISPGDSLSKAVTSVNGAVAAINGTYGETVQGGTVSYIKCDDIIKQQVTIPSTSLYFWKHEGAFYYNNYSRTAGIEYGDNKKYQSWSYPNIISGAPVLINNHNPVGETFVNQNVSIEGLPDENPNKHQGIRAPRTAVAITKNNKILLITVDGRRAQTAGMNARELTQFIKKYFDPKYALNIDGGGSTTMWIKDSKASATNVVNYPTDDGKYTHHGQRKLSNAIVVTKNN